MASNYWGIPRTTSAQSAYKLTPKLFVRRDGKFVEFTGNPK